MDLKKTIDEIDLEIITLLQNDPSLTHSKIAEKLNRSQPAIGARIKKLTSRGILATQIGINFKEMSEINLVKVDLKTTRAMDILELAEFCPYILNAMKISGEFNITLFLASSSLKKIDSVIDRHFREKKYVNRIQMDVISRIAKNFVLPMNFMGEKYDEDFDPCKNNPICSGLRKEAKARSPLELNLT